MCVLVQEDPLLLKWIDATTFETEFQLEVRVNGSAWLPYDPPTMSTTMASTGAQYSVLTNALPMNSVYIFRVRSFNRYTGQASAWSSPSSECYTPQVPSWQVGCYEGQVYLQGRSEHSDALILYHGFPITTADNEGYFRFCGAVQGSHRISSRGACYLESLAPDVWVGAGRTTTLPFTALRGGDVINDDWVNLYDLVRVGAAYGTTPPADPAADCNRDGSINLFDLVMVGSNYGVRGPVPWGASWVDGAAAADDGSIVDPFGFEATTQGVPGGVPVELPGRTQGDDEMVVDLTVRDARGLYGAEMVIAYDPARLAVVDSGLQEHGVQVSPGDAWPVGSSYIARNSVDAERGEIRFAASLLRPSEGLDGDAHVLRITFKVLDGDGADGYRLTNVQLADASGHPIGSRWSGVEIHRVADLLLPIVKVNRANR
ncbi:MAG: cohesin domain-containing protein [Anaerolineae bacterium]